MNAIYRLLNLLLTLYTYGLIAYVLLSWASSPEMYRIRSWLGQYYEPVLRPLQKAFKPLRIGGAMIDPSAIILFIGLYFAKRIIYELFYGFP